MKNEIKRVLNKFIIVFMAVAVLTSVIAGKIRIEEKGEEIISGEKTESFFYPEKIGKIKLEEKEKILIRKAASFTPMAPFYYAAEALYSIIYTDSQ
ncbi:MAG: hypothetical protein IJ262_08145 [Clostridia bacterium]|nr:hypothetical protein [Clostridia bacterium]